MTSGKVLFIDTAHPYLSEELTRRGFTCFHYTGTDRNELLKQLHLYDGLIIRSKIKLDKEALDHTKHLRFIARVGAGMENIDLPYAESLGITCLNAPEGNRDAVGEHATGMLLALLNHLCRVNTEVRKGIWIREGNRGTEICGKTVAIIGYGNMGSAFAQRMRGFNARVIAYDKYKSGFGNDWVDEVQMDEVFKEADIVSLHLPLTDETNQLVDAAYLAKFRKPIFIVNTARGQCINTRALVEALESGRVSGAALDVLEFEKLSFENLDAANLPEAFKQLISSDKVLLSPHIAGWTNESNYKMAKVLVDKILAL
ncbi:MAG: NAD(P)-dependent oxidoreductase [Lentimicrobiaceae bacterium]